MKIIFISDESNNIDDNRDMISINKGMVGLNRKLINLYSKIFLQIQKDLTKKIKILNCENIPQTLPVRNQFCQNIRIKIMRDRNYWKKF